MNVPAARCAPASLLKSEKSESKFQRCSWNAISPRHIVIFCKLLMEKAHFICGCLESESFSLLLLDICLPVPVGASSEWERVGARPSAPARAPQFVQARRHSWSGTAGAG